MPQRPSGDINLEDLARLSKLNLPAEVRPQIVEDIHKIISHFELLDELDTISDDTTLPNREDHCPLREDVAYRDESVAQEIRDRAPQLKENHFCVPPVIGRKT